MEAPAVPPSCAQQPGSNGFGIVSLVDPKTLVSFTLNGEAIVVENASPYLSLNDWLRSQPGFSGTKKMCGEGGCGCCVVTVTRLDPGALEESTIAINSVSFNRCAVYIRPPPPPPNPTPNHTRTRRTLLCREGCWDVKRSVCPLPPPPPPHHSASVPCTQ